MEWWIWVLIGIAVVAIVAVMVIASRQRRARLRDQFGSEYDRTMIDADSRRHAEGELRDRLKRHRALDLRPLEPEAAAKYSQEWMVIQARFVDAPDEACTSGEQLLVRVLRDRGYPVDEDFDTQADLVSVDHPDLVGDYRRAHEMLHAENEGEQRLDELRAVFLVHRDLFSDLLDNGVERGVEQDDEIDLTQSTRDDVRR